MTPRGRALGLMHRVAVALIVGNVALGYGAAYGYVAIASHIAWGFFSALAVAFAHAMTMFYFAGIGVSMREAAAGRRSCAPHLAAAAALRRRLAAPLGIALVSLMAAVILGGGAHTRTLPSWAHHVAALSALIVNLLALGRTLVCVRANESLVARVQEAIGGEPAAAGGAVDRAAGGG